MLGVLQTVKKWNKECSTNRKNAYFEFRLRNCENQKIFWNELRYLNILSKIKNHFLPIKLKNLKEINEFSVNASNSDFSMDINLTDDYYKIIILPNIYLNFHQRTN